MTSHFKSTVECYDCHQQVYNLKDHRKTCSNSKYSKSTINSSKTFNSTVECYDCHQQVNNLRDHRKICPRNTKITNPAMVNTRDIYFIVDVSGSMSGVKLDSAKSVITEVHTSLPDNDRMAIITFDDHPFFKLRPRAVGQIKQQNEIPELMNRIFAKGSTALYDAIWIAIEQLQDKSRKTLMIVLTDGMDNSSKHSYNEVLDLLKEYPNIELNIVHIDKSKEINALYQKMCENRGTYKVIDDDEIVPVIKRIIIEYYEH